MAKDTEAYEMPDNMEDPDVSADEAQPAQEKKSSKATTIFVPKVQNMDDYFIKHYKAQILQQLNQLLVDGELSKVARVPIVSERIQPGECCFRRFNYWRLNKTDFWIQIDLRIELKINTSAGIDSDLIWFCLKLWFSFADDEEECAVDDICLLENKQEYEDCWRLDKYLVPVLRRDEIDLYTEQVWEQYYPQAAKDGTLRSPSALAEKMGLSIQEMPLYQRGGTRAVIFFHEDKNVLVSTGRACGEREEPPPRSVKVPASTIVLNNHSAKSHDFDLDIYHECIHYDWHYLFYQLQNMHNNDVRQLKTVKRTVLKDKDFSNPIEFMEQQARYGSYGLMMPASFMRETIAKLYKESFTTKRRDGFFDHDGRRLEVIARTIAKTYTLSKASIRARMIQLGYPAARGALNFVDGEYITPFAYSENEKANGSETYVIDRQTVLMLYKTDKLFREIMQTGRFAYVDGHVVHFDTANVITNKNGAQLSGWANAHIDRVCLRFTKEYTKDHKFRYIFGQMNNDEAVQNTFRFLDANGTMTDREHEMARRQYLKEMPDSFHGALTYIMKGKMTVEELAGRIGVSRSTVLRLRTDERKHYDLDQVIAIIIALNLPPWLSDALLEKARLSVKATGAFGYYRTILDCYYTDSIEKVQSFLKGCGFDPLNLNFATDVENQDAS